MKILRSRYAIVLVAFLVGLAPSVFAQSASTANGAAAGAAAPGTGASDLTAADLPGHDQPAITLTVSEAIQRAEANQPLIEQAQNQVRAAQAGVGLAQSGYYPHISGSGSYTRVEPNQSFTFAFPYPAPRR